jgi:hypothetical protein
MEWTVEELFLATYLAAGLTGLGELLLSGRPLSWKSIIGTFVRYGAAGVVLGAIGYEVLNGRQYPIRILACGMGVGVRLITLGDIGTVIKKLFLNGHEKPKT